LYLRPIGESYPDGRLPYISAPSRLSFPVSDYMMATHTPGGMESPKRREDQDVVVTHRRPLVRLPLFPRGLLLVPVLGGEEGRFIQPFRPGEDRGVVRLNVR
jgi:hypothetical protein